MQDQNITNPIAGELSELLSLDPASVQLALANGSLDAITSNLFGPDAVAKQLKEFKDDGLTKEQVYEQLDGFKQELAGLHEIVAMSYGEDGPHNEVLIRLLDPVLDVLQKVYDQYDMGDCEIMVELLPGGVMPKAAHEDDGGMDVYANADITLAPNEIAIVPIGIKVAIPQGWRLAVNPRSGLSRKGISVANAPGTIDAHYHDEVGVILRNDSEEGYVINKGDRIAQIALEKVYRPSWKIVENLAEAVDTPSRANAEGAQGFGSTGR